MGIGAKSNFVAAIVSYLHAFNTHYIKKKKEKKQLESGLVVKNQLLKKRQERKPRTKSNATVFCMLSP